MARHTETILVTGATGRQGGAVARHLQAGKWNVRAMTRDPNKPDAEELREAGMDVVPGNFDDRGSLQRALQGVYGAYSVQNAWEAGSQGEVRQGQGFADAARDAGVEHLVYSSVGGAQRDTGIPHFDSKWRIEQHIRALNLPATILRPVFFMENFLGPPFHEAIRQGTLPMAMDPDTPLQMIAVDDIGAFAALAFNNPDDFLGQALELAGDEMTMPRAAELLSQAVGQEVRFQQVPLEQLRQQAGEDTATMFRWFNEQGYQAAIPALRQMHPQLMNFQSWLRLHWR